MSLFKSLISRNNTFFQLVLFIIFLKFALLATGLVAYNTLIFSDKNYKANFNHPQNEKKHLIPLKTWDAQHYLYLAEKGYVKNSESNRFFPLYPLAIKAASFLTQNILVASYILSLIFSIGSGILLYKISILHFKIKEIATLSTVLLFVFPSAFFLSLPYTESLFLFLSLLFFYSLEIKKIKYTLLCSILLPLTRPTGILIIIPLFVYFFMYTKNLIQFKLPTFNKPIRFNVNTNYLFLLFPLFGILIYLLFQYLIQGNPTAGLEGHTFVSNWNVANLVDPGSMIRNLIGTKMSIHGFENSLIDRIFFVLFLCFLPYVYKTVPRHYFYFTLALGLIPLLGSFTSFTRYLLPAFPIFLCLAKLLYHPNRAFIKYSVLFLFFALQIVFFIMHILNYWVA